MVDGELIGEKQKRVYGGGYLIFDPSRFSEISNGRS